MTRFVNTILAAIGGAATAGAFFLIAETIAWAGTGCCAWCCS